MQKFTWRLLSIFLLTFSFFGSGCVVVGPQQLTPEEAALSISFSAESQLTLRETVLGLGGKFVRFFQQEDTERSLMFDAWNFDQNAKMHWQRVLQAETSASILARKEYYAKLASAPIGSDYPDPPSPIFEETIQKGSLITFAFSQSSKVFLPLFWKQDQETGEGSTLLWLSKKQYDELIRTRRTNVNLGLFDDSVSYAVGLTDSVKNFVDRIRGSENSPAEQNILEIKADLNWDTYTLSVDGVPTVVRAIHAQNAFARYTILANQENPLILELMLSPASRGSLNLFSRKALGDAFWGYEVTSISKKVSK